MPTSCDGTFLDDIEHTLNGESGERASPDLD
jgi:hypothetical protein